MLSLDLRKRIVEAYLNGEGSQRQLAKRFSVSASSVERFLRRYRQTASLAPEPARGGRRRILRDQDCDLINAWLKERSDMTQHEIAERFMEQTGRSVSRRTISRVLGRIRQTLKKRA